MAAWRAASRPRTCQDRTTPALCWEIFRVGFGGGSLLWGGREGWGGVGGSGAMDLAALTAEAEGAALGAVLIPFETPLGTLLPGARVAPFYVQEKKKKTHLEQGISAKGNGAYVGFLENNGAYFGCF